jgi:hypothetical protein
MTLPWPEPVRATTTPRCTSCHRPVPSGKLTEGLGESCARDHGLIVHTPRLRTEAQTGPDLFTNPEEEDHCDGYDR